MGRIVCNYMKKLYILNIKKKIVCQWSQNLTVSEDKDII